MDLAERVPARAIERQIETEYGRDRIARALYEVIRDGLVFGPREMPTPADREWIRAAMALPMQESAEVALHVLAWRLSQVLEDAPDGFLTRFQAAQRWAELGWDEPDRR